MKLTFVRDLTLSHPDATYVKGAWYDNVSPAHAAAALADGAALEVHAAPCKCLLASDHRVVRLATVHGRPCADHGTIGTIGTTGEV